MKHVFTRRERLRGASRGGRAVKSKQPPPRCVCGCSRTTFRNWHSYLGHLGLVAYARNHHGGDLQAAIRYIQALGISATDPCPWNGAFAREHALAAVHRQTMAARQVKEEITSQPSAPDTQRDTAETPKKMPPRPRSLPLPPSECQMCGRPTLQSFCSYDCELELRGGW